MLHYLRVKGINRQKRLDKTKTKEYKKKRKTAEFKKIKVETANAISACAKREGAVYQPGIGMTEGYQETELLVDDKDGKEGERKPAVTQNRKPKKRIPVN